MYHTDPVEQGSLVLQDQNRPVIVNVSAGGTGNDQIIKLLKESIGVIGGKKS